LRERDPGLDGELDLGRARWPLCGVCCPQPGGCTAWPAPRSTAAPRSPSSCSSSETRCHRRSGSRLSKDPSSPCSTPSARTAVCVFESCRKMLHTSLKPLARTHRSIDIRRARSLSSPINRRRTQ
jgi:hypothetical protein